MVIKNRFWITPLYIPRFFAITFFTIFNSISAFFHDLVFKKRVEETELAAPPLFVLGHWRSGTTLLHELLIRDKNHTYANTYQCFAPHHFLLTEKIIRQLTGWVLEKKRPMDNMEAGWANPQEDEFALCSLGVPTPYQEWAFPQNGPVYSEYLDLHAITETERTNWKTELRLFLKRLTLRSPKRIILKSPPHTARIKTLLEEFPDARFVHIARDPRDLYPSTMRLWYSLNDVQGMHFVPFELDWLPEHIVSNFERMYAAYEVERDLIPAGRLVEITYEDLIANPVEKIRTIYEQLELGDYSKIRPSIQAYFESQKEYKKNVHHLDPQDLHMIETRWKSYFERFGYPISETNQDSE